MLIITKLFSFRGVALSILGVVAFMAIAMIAIEVLEFMLWCILAVAAIVHGVRVALVFITSTTVGTYTALGVVGFGLYFVV